MNAAVPAEKMYQQYAQFTQNIETLQLRLDQGKYGSQAEKERLETILKGQLSARQPLDDILIPKLLQHDMIADRIMNVALGNSLLLLIHHSDTIVDVICEMEEDGLVAPRTEDAFKVLADKHGKEKIGRYLAKVHPYERYVESAIDNDPQLQIDYEWVMGEFGQHDLEFETCCQSLGIDPNRIRGIIQFAEKLPFEQLVEAYEIYMAIASQSELTGIRNVMDAIPEMSVSEE